jgi:hypothetical protein
MRGFRSNPVNGRNLRRVAECRARVGAGIRLPAQGLALFEAVVNAVHSAALAAAIASNTVPEAMHTSDWQKIKNIASLTEAGLDQAFTRCRIPVPLTAMGRTSLFRGRGREGLEPGAASGSGRRERQMLPHSGDIKIASDLTLRVLTLSPVPQMIGAGPLPVPLPVT